eukprot:SAG25_NODE_1216_length_3588_cov_3.421324_5_plen_80_part_00
MTVVSHFTPEERAEMLQEGGGLDKLENIEINHTCFNTVKRSHLANVISPGGDDDDDDEGGSGGGGGMDYDAVIVSHCSH